MSGSCLKVDSDLWLKEVQASDAQEVFTLTNRNRSYLREWLPWLDHTQAVGDTLQFIETCRIQAQKNEALQFCIWWDNRIVGKIGYHRFDFSNRATSLGYWLDAEAQGRGIMTRSCKALVDYAFSDLKMNRVEIRCAVKNERSRAIPERLGFQAEGVLREAEWIYDHFVDLEVYGMLTNDWKR